MLNAGSAFNPTAFLTMQQTEVNVRRPPLPVVNPADTVNGLYTGIIGEVKVETGVISKGDRVGQSWVAVKVPVTIEICSELQGTGQPAKLTFTDNVFLDLTESGTLDNSIGKNNRQRMYREALNLNKAGSSFAWQMAQGQPLKLKIRHEMTEDGNVREAIGNLFPMA